MAKINVRMEYFLDKQSRQMKVIFAIIKLLMIYIFKKMRILPREERE